MLHLVDPTTGLTIDDTTITGGNATSSGTGGGVYAPLGTLEIRRSTIRGNRSSGTGGGAAGATVTVQDTVVSQNQAATSGGGIFAAGPLTLERTAVVANNAGTCSTCEGGGVNALNSVVIVDSSFVSNAAGFGGGVRSTPGSLQVTRTTMQGNRAAFWGGGIYGTSSDPVELTDSTFSGNTAVFAGAAVAVEQAFTVDGPKITNGTFVSNTGAATIEFWASTCSPPPGTFCPPPPGNLTITRTIVAAPTGLRACALGSPFFQPSVESVTDGGFNLISNGGDCTFGNAAAPILGSLADNGGPTHTHLPLVGSPAIDGGGACTGNDQRGVSRPQGPACDIGAVEVAG